MKKLLLIFFVFVLMSSTYAMCPRMTSSSGNANYIFVEKYDILLY